MDRKFLFASALSAALLMGAPFACAQTDTDSDRAFIAKAIKGDNSEVVLGKLAEQKGASEGVRSFGSMLATDHGKGKEDAEKVAHKLGVTPSDDITPEASREKQKLENLSGEDFDREFADHMVNDHKKDIAEYESHENSGNQDVATLVRNTLPTLKKHLSMAEELKNSK